MENVNKIEQNEFENISRMLLDSFLLECDEKSILLINKKEALLEQFGIFLEKYLQLHFLTSAKDKLQLINFIDKLNMQRELLELKRGEIELSDTKVAGERLGKKAQSAFNGK